MRSRRGRRAVVERENKLGDLRARVVECHAAALRVPQRQRHEATLPVDVDGAEVRLRDVRTTASGTNTLYCCNPRIKARGIEPRICPHAMQKHGQRHTRSPASTTSSSSSSSFSSTTVDILLIVILLSLLLLLILLLIEHVDLLLIKIFLSLFLLSS